MKKCPICGTVSSEKDAACGVCGTSLAQVEVESNIAPSMRHPSTDALLSSAKTRHADRRTQGILGLLLGIGMVATGVLIIELIALVGILMLLFGFTVIATDISWMRGNTFYDRDEPIIHGRVPLRDYAGQKIPWRSGFSLGAAGEDEENASSETPPGSSPPSRDERTSNQ